MVDGQSKYNDEQRTEIGAQRVAVEDWPAIEYGKCKNGVGFLAHRFTVWPENSRQLCTSHFGKYFAHGIVTWPCLPHKHATRSLQVLHTGAAI